MYSGKEILSMNDLISLTARKVQDVVEEKGSVSLSHLETMVDSSYHLIFLAIDQLVADKKIRLIKGEFDYTLSSCEDFAMASLSKEETIFMKREKILIVDDDLDMLSLIDWHLNRLGYSTSVAVDGLEAMKRIGECKPDLVILDVMMPEVDGLKLCRWIKNNKDGMISNLHVLVLSALSRPADKALALSAGANDYITKPFDMIDLVLSIETIFNQCLLS